MDSLFGRTPRVHAHYHRPGAAPASAALPDYNAFDAPDDSDAAADDDEHGYTLASDATARPLAPAQDPFARSATAASSSSASPASPAVLPGAYDFEPQAEPLRAPAHGPAPGVPLRSRPPSLRSGYGPTAAAAASDNDDDLRYGRPHSSSAGDAGGALAGWRGIVARLRGHSTAPALGDSDGAGHRSGESHGLLFSQDHDESDETDHEGPARSRSSYPPMRNSHLPLPARPPQFAPPSSSSAGPAPGGRIFGGGQGNDGVFANLAAKPDNPNGDDIVGEGPGKDEVLPPYEAATMDPSPQYWETTVITPDGLYGPDDILVDGLPVGNFFSFVWNLLVSMSFQFVGFLLTYILHTTHAAKNGSRAGLGVTLIQLGFYLKQRTDHPEYLVDPSLSGDETGLNGALGPTVSGAELDAEAQRWSWWGGFDDATPTSAAATATLTALGSLPTQVRGALAGMLDASDPEATASALPSLQGNGVTEEEMTRMSLAANEWMAFAMVTVGSFLLIGSCLAYWRAVRYARAIRQGQGPGADAENILAV